MILTSQQERAMPECLDNIATSIGTSPTFHQTTTLFYNLMTVALYFNSIDEFPQHAQNENGSHWLGGRISKEMGGNSGLQTAFAWLLLFCLALLYSNQITFPKRVKKLLSFEPDEPDQNTSKRKTLIFFALISAIFKALTTSSSLYALLVNIISDASNNTTGFYGGITLTAACLPGNFFAQFSVFLEYFHNDKSIKKGAHILSHYFALSYAISNAALYFNAYDAAPSHIGWTDHRLTTPKTTGDYIALATGILLSLIFLASTWARFYERIYKLIGPGRCSKNNEKNYLLINESESERNLFEFQDIKWSDKCNLSTLHGGAGTIAAFWKSIVTSGSILGILASNTPWKENKNIEISCLTLISIMSIFGFFPQLSLYARSNEKIINEKIKSAKQTESSYCCSLFKKSNTKGNEASADELRLIA
jgi:hypothetical protein